MDLFLHVGAFVFLSDVLLLDTCLTFIFLIFDFDLVYIFFFYQCCCCCRPYYLLWQNFNTDIPISFNLSIILDFLTFCFSTFNSYVKIKTKSKIDIFPNSSKNKGVRICFLSFVLAYITLVFDDVVKISTSFGDTC